MALALTEENFDKIVNSGKIVLVDFWAEWCMPCRMIGPIFEELANEMDADKVTFTKCDVDTERNIAVKFSITSIPSILFFKDGQVMDQVVGAVPKRVIVDQINELI
ncbi:MAG: thioredoxin [Candidatus Celaenobacter antarcticus]|nr:thioredoxin [Candidatus Celaenobacter antarcticus]